MSESTSVEKICELLADPRRYGDLGRQAGQRLRRWLSGALPHASPEILERHLSPQRLDLVFDAFWQVLPFGTGGRRGPVGYGPNRMNPTTVAMTVQGHCEYLRGAFPDRDDLAVVVANDVRVFHDVAGRYRFLGGGHPLLGVSSRSLGRLACEIYAGNGLTAYFAAPRQDDAVLTTPELSFLIGELGAVGGINLSASHNPPDDNGVKVYDAFGSQPVAPDDQRLVDAMKATQITSLAFDEALETGKIREIPSSHHRDYVRRYVDLYASVHAPDPELPVVYTPLCGCGLTTVGDVLDALGFPFRAPPGQDGPDGTFAAIPFKAPNPEVPQSTAPARAFADAIGSGVVLSSDPDADRVGVEVKLEGGTWYHFDGNQIAAVLCYFLMLDPAGPRRRGLVIETLVTTKILAEIVEKAGDSWIVDDLLVGFKYVADVLKKLDAEGHYRGLECKSEQLVLAAEESHGVVMLPAIRDKDSTPACMYLAALYQRLAHEGRTLLDYYVAILEELGGFDSVNRSIMMAGAAGMMQKDRIMSALRDSPPAVLGGQTVNRFVDYWDEDAFGPFVSETDEMPRNVLQMFTDSFVITIRPSGTEPKLKLYCQLLPYGEPSGARGHALLREVRARADTLARRIYNELLAVIGVSLSEASLFLPDIVDLGGKQKFEERTIPELRAALEAGRFADVEAALAWLREESAAMTPGSDPLPALKAPVAYLCGEWTDVESPVLEALREWAL
jgi:phosphoglucomutase/phosphomannomutase